MNDTARFQDSVDFLRRVSTQVARDEMVVSRQKMDTTVQLTSVFDIHMTKEYIYFVFWDGIGDGEQVNIVKLAVTKRETFQAG